jgi:hypothetical protein
MKFIGLLTGYILAVISGIPAVAQVSPYGICAHVSRGGDHEIAAQQFARMNEAGIGWARTDFDWTSVQRSQGAAFDFARFDKTVQLATEAKITILPILDYDTPWARPVIDHLDDWRAFVRAIVTRYKDRLRYWEVWNEPDLKQFWRQNPSPAEYAVLLKATYEEVKRIDPKLTVLLGGLSQIPFEYIEGVYKAGGKDHFDIMNVHPYRYPAAPEIRPLVDDLKKLRELMSRYGDAAKPIWITEIGYPTHKPPLDTLKSVVRTGLSQIRPDKKSWKMAALNDPAYSVSMLIDDSDLAKMLPTGGYLSRVTLGQIASGKLAGIDALILPPDESFPAEAFDAIESFVRSGGVLILGRGVPLYYALRKDPDGQWRQTGADDSFRRRLHIGWQGWWTDKDKKTPEWIDNLSVPEALSKQIQTPDAKTRGERFLNRSALKDGDTMIPLLTGSKGDWTGVVAAAYKFNSDLKGGLVVCTLSPDIRGVSPDLQAALLARTYLLAFAGGVDTVFWYNLRAFENDPFYNEDHFGIVHTDLTPKPAFVAYQALTRARPAGSKQIETKIGTTGSARCVAWTRPDGKLGFALWDYENQRNYSLSIDGVIDQAFDHLGKPISIPVTSGKLTLSLSPGPIYLIGPKQISDIQIVP